MPLFTSNSEYMIAGHSLKTGHNLTVVVLIATIISLTGMLGWEMYCRSEGYRPTLNDDRDLWVIQRDKVDENSKATVLIGASRILFGFDLDVYEQAFGERPIQLSTVGVNAGIYLEDLAQDAKFRGTVIIDYSPGLFFSEGHPAQTPKDNIKRYRSITLSQRVSSAIGRVLDQNLAFIEPEDLTLSKLIAKIGIPNRAGTVLPPELPPYFYTVESDRQGALGERVEKDKEFAARIQNIWLGLMSPADDGLSLEEREARELEHTNMIVERTVKNVRLIEKKGGRVIFIQYPSTGPVRDLENRLNPREKYWDRIIAETRSPGINYEDYSFLKDFKCPEGGHISKADRVIFTTLIIPLLRDIYAETSHSDSTSTRIELPAPASGPS